MKQKQGKEKKKSFRNFQEEFLTMLEESLRNAGQVTKREFDRISERIQSRLEAKYGKEKVDDFAARAKANWQEIAGKFDEASVRLESRDSFRKGKEIGVQVLEGLAAAIKKAAENLEATLSDRVTYHAGQTVDKGVYLCIQCSQIQEVKRRRKLPVCHECGSSEYRMA